MGHLTTQESSLKHYFYSFRASKKNKTLTTAQFYYGTLE